MESPTTVDEIVKRSRPVEDDDGHYVCRYGCGMKYKATKHLTG